MSNEIAVKDDPGVIETITDSKTDLYEGLSKLEIPNEAQTILLQQLTPDMIEIKPTGELYVGHVWYRKVLNKAFGVGKWALKPLGQFVRPAKNLVCREYALYIGGQYAASAIGEQVYVENNPMMTWGDACEATKSNAIMRCCKDMGMSLECWDKRFIENFKREHCVKVYRKKEGRWCWRRRDAEPWEDEGEHTAQKTSNKPATSYPSEKKDEKQVADNVEGDLISEAQCKRFYAIAKGAGWKDDDLKAWLVENYKIDSTKKISRTIYEHICDKVKEDVPHDLGMDEPQDESL